MLPLAWRTIAWASLPLVAGCGPSSGPLPSAPLGTRASSITVTSRSLPNDQQLPVEYSCDGKDLSPQLTWSSPPEGTRSISIVVDDPDAGSGFTHWLVLNLPPETLTLAEGADPAALGARIGRNGFRNVQYNGPCPPHGDMHRYQFHVYAADRALPLEDGATRAQVDEALHGHVLGAGTLVVTFSH